VHLAARLVLAAAGTEARAVLICHAGTRGHTAAGSGSTPTRRASCSLPTCAQCCSDARTEAAKIGGFFFVAGLRVVPRTTRLVGLKKERTLRCSPSTSLSRESALTWVESRAARCTSWLASSPSAAEQLRTPAMGVTVVTKKPGDGVNRPQKGDRVEVHYTGKGCPVDMESADGALIRSAQARWRTASSSTALVSAARPSPSTWAAGKSSVPGTKVLHSRLSFFAHTCSRARTTQASRSYLWANVRRCRAVQTSRAVPSASSELYSRLAAQLRRARHGLHPPPLAAGVRRGVVEHRVRCAGRLRWSHSRIPATIVAAARAAGRMGRFGTRPWARSCCSCSPAWWASGYTTR